MKRAGLSKKLRFEIFKRDGFVCQYCGRHPPEITLELDHIIPICSAGTSDGDNLITACFDCNRGKAGNSLSIAPKSLKQKSAEIAESEEQLLGYRAVMQAKIDRMDRDRWAVAEVLVPGSGTDGMSLDWLRGIKTFNERLPLHVVLDAAEMARARKPYSDRQRFYYFCGICWNKIRGEIE